MTLHNYPKHLQNLTRDDGEHLDLAAVDILRDRERGVPRYNQFRRLLHKRRSSRSTSSRTTRSGAKSCAGLQQRPREGRPDDGLYAEPLPEGFGFSDTAFRIFILMASRRLKSDRFFTDDFVPEIYTRVRHRLHQEHDDGVDHRAAAAGARADAQGRRERVRAVDAGAKTVIGGTTDRSRSCGRLTSHRPCGLPCGGSALAGSPGHAAARGRARAGLARDVGGLARRSTRCSSSTPRRTPPASSSSITPT